MCALHTATSVLPTAADESPANFSLNSSIFFCLSKNGQQKQKARKNKRNLGTPNPSNKKKKKTYFILSAVRSIPFSGTSELSGSLAGRDSKCYASKNINAVGFGSRFDFFASTTRNVISFLSRAAKHSAISRATSCKEE